MAIVNYGLANKIRQQVAEICQGLIDDQANFAKRGDREWVYLSLAEACQGLGLAAEEALLARTIQSVTSDFAKETYSQQRIKLQALMDEFKQRYRPDELSAAPAGPAAAGLPEVPARRDTPARRLAGAEGAHPITIDADIAPGRQVKSIEISCKIEYD